MAEKKPTPKLAGFVKTRTFKSAVLVSKGASRFSNARLLTRGEREEIHKKTFTKWMNAKLRQRSPPSQVTNLYMDLADGRLLLNLLEVLLDKKLKREKGNLRVHKLNNVEQALLLLDKQQVKLVGINGFEIVDGKPRAILGLMWSIILRFQVQGVMQESESDAGVKDFSVEKKLLEWCKERLSGYEDRVKLKDFSESWRDGWAFNAILHSYGIKAFDMGSLEKMDPKTRLEHAFHFANDEHGIAPLLEPSDIAVEKPDKKLLIMYLTSMYDHLEGPTAVKRRKSIMPEEVVVVDAGPSLEAAAPGLDQMDTGPSAGEILMEELTGKLDDVEKGISRMDTSLPKRLDSNKADLETTKKSVEEHKLFLEALEPVDAKTQEVLKECRGHIGDGVLGTGQEKELEERTSTINKRLDALQTKAEQGEQATNDVRSLLLKQKLNELNEKLDDVEGDIFRMESKMPQHPDSKTVDQETAQKHMEDDRNFLEELDPVQVKTSQVLQEGRSYTAEGTFPKAEQEELDKRMNGIDERIQALAQKAQKDKKGSQEMHLLLLNQQMNRLKDDITSAEKQSKKFPPIGPDYVTVQKQVEEHQKFMNELQENSPMATFINLDPTDPAMDSKTRDQIKSLTARWNDVWKKSDERRQKLDKVLTAWQKFRDEQVILLNWLAQKEKVLRDMENTDITDEKQVQSHLDILQAIETELEEQSVRLQAMQKLGEKIIEENDNNEKTRKVVARQLDDFDDCWNSVAKQVIERKERLSTAEKKYKEFSSAMDAVDEWMDETEKLLKKHSEDMNEEDKESLLHHVEARCDERPTNRTKVDRINRLGKDLAGKPDSPSDKVIQEELGPFNERWKTLNARLEGYSDKGYPDSNTCCLVRMFKRKFKSMKA